MRQGIKDKLVGDTGVSSGRGSLTPLFPSRKETP
jgi:hypothetical protein